ncbi:MAG: LysM peptidoglycan-binding domain-containing protein [Verrucomicrobiales bacterium]
MKAFTVILFSAAIGWSSITPVSGETLSGLFKRYGIDLEQLVVDNPELVQSARRNPSPQTGAGAVTDSNTPKPKPAANGSHTVEEGDTLSEIASRYDTSTSEIMALNNLTDTSALRIGQQLRVPSLSAIASSSGAKFTTAPAGQQVRVPGASGRVVPSSSGYPGNDSANTEPVPVLKNAPKADARRPRGPVIIITPPRPIVSHG